MAAEAEKNINPAQPEQAPAPSATLEMPEAETPLVARLKQQAPRDRRAQKQLSTVTVLFVATFALAVFFPSFRRLSDLHERIVAGAQQLQSNRERGKALPDLRARADSLQSQLASFKPLAAERDVPGIINDMVGFGTISQLREFNQQQQEPSLDASLGIWPIRMTFEGNFENVYSFLRRCEQMPTAVRINDISIKQKPGVPGAAAQPGDVTVSMLLNVYYVAEHMASVQ